MFEEDFERCFICEKVCKGLYCSSECRQRDQGSHSSAVHSNLGPVKITSQLPAALSPLVRPMSNARRSPLVHAQNRATSSVSSGSSSSVSSSPLQSPQTNPSDADSPKKDTFDLPPLAYPSKFLNSGTAAPSSIPMKIPALISRATVPQSAGQTPGSQGSTIYPAGASIDTLRFGRKPSAINSVTSPNALIPRCACGKPANHRGRASSKDRADLAEAGFSRLSLGPSVVGPPQAQEEPPLRSSRIASDSSIPPFADRSGPSGLITPIRLPVPLSIPHSPSIPATATLLSRSRSDPIPSSLMSERKGIPAVPGPVPVSTNVITPSYRESRAGPMSPIVPAQPTASRPSRRMTNALEVGMPSPRRGRSREKQEHHVGHLASNPLGGPADREQAPSRSRNRRESRRRSDSRERERGRGRSELSDRERDREHSGQRSPRSPLNANAPQILPSWSRRASEAQADQRKLVGEGVVPVMRRTISGDKKTPPSGLGPGRSEEERERNQEELKRATEQLGQVFGVAAG